MGFDSVEGVREGEPEVDFLGGGAGGDVAGEFCDGLDGFDPGVDVGVEGVEEGGVGEEFLGLDVGDVGADVEGLGLCKVWGEKG